jgi:hypothetical protein
MEQKSDEKDMTCGVYKQDKTMCGLPAVDAFSVADPKDKTHTRVVSIILLCEKHSKGLDDGKVYLVQGSDGKIFMVDYQIAETSHRQSPRQQKTGE